MTETKQALGETDLRTALEGAMTQRGETLARLSDRSPLLLIFLRHFG